jgi:hypothetical protein
VTAATITVEKATDWRDDGWTSFPNRIIRAPGMCALEKIVFGWFASHLSTFEFSLDDLVADMEEGRNKCRDAVRGLEEKGLITRHKVHDPLTGRIVGTKYRLHHTPVPEADRTFVPSTAKKRPPRFPQNSTSEPAPDRPGPGEPAAEAPPENPRPEPAPDRPGAGRPGAGRPGAGRSGVPIYGGEDHGKHQEEEGVTVDERPPDPAPPGPPPPRSLPAWVNLADPSSWVCRRHHERPVPVGEYRPPCGPCGQVREAARAVAPDPRESEHAAAVAAERAAVAVARDCPWCIESPVKAGQWWRVDERRVPLAPVVVCDHSEPSDLPETHSESASGQGSAEVRRILAEKARARSVGKV